VSAPTPTVRDQELVTELGGIAAEVLARKGYRNPRIDGITAHYRRELGQRPDDDPNGPPQMIENLDVHAIVYEFDDPSVYPAAPPPGAALRHVQRTVLVPPEAEAAVFRDELEKLPTVAQARKLAAAEAKQATKGGD
jgi:hypothetical protein